MKCELCGEISRGPRVRVDGLLLCDRCSAGARAAAALVRDAFDRALADYRDRMVAGCQDPAIVFID